MPIDPLTTMTAGTALAGPWIWDNYGKDIVNWLGESAIKKWERVNWGRAARRYLSNLGYIYSTTRILGKNEPIRLDDIYTDVYILDKPTAYRLYDIEQLKETFDEDRYVRPGVERRNGLDLIRQGDKGHRLFILGKPGAGKTTFLKYITLQATRSKIDDKVPIFVSLKEWSDSSSDLLTFIVKLFEICNFPDAQPFVEHLLKSGKAIVLFDGLDEINEENNLRSRANTTLNNFCRQYHDTQCLITCRIAATDYNSFEAFTYVEMADFTDEQIRIFAEKWFPDKEVQRKFLEEFFNVDNERLQELGRIPLLLTLLCLAFEANQRFPQRRVEVYDRAIDALLKKWRISDTISRDKVYRSLSTTHKRKMLAHIAAETFKKGEYFLRQRNLENQIVKYLHNLSAINIEDIDGEAVLKSIEAQHGLFVERAWGIYSFSHLTFQEYFTAEYFINAEEDELNNLIGNYSGDNRWREVFLLTASLLEEDKAKTFFTVFRQSVDRLIGDDKDLIKFLLEIEQVAASVDARFKPSAIRAAFCYYSLFRTSKHDLSRGLAHALDLTRTLGLDLSLDPSRAPSRGYELHLSRVRSRAGKIPPLNKTLKIEQINQLMRYIEANRLLIDCLKLAKASNRGEIENSLLLPPQK